jgi:hypothetical protein
MKAVEPRGNTKIGTYLEKKILKPLIYDIVKSGKTLERPIIVSCITDGCPGGESPEKFKEMILKCVRFLREQEYPPTGMPLVLIILMIYISKIYLQVANISNSYSIPNQSNW